MALTTALLWSFAFVCIRETLRQFQSFGATPWQAALALFQLRMLMTAFCFIPGVVRHRRWIGALNGGDWLRVGLLTLTMSFGYHIPLSLGAVEIPSGLTSLLIATSPIFAAVLARLFLKENLGLARVIAVLLGATGIAICLMAQGRLGFSDIHGARNIVAPLFVLAAACDGALFAVLARTVPKDIPASFKLGLAMIATVLLAIPLWDSATLKLLSQLNAWGWAAIAYLAVVCTYAASLLWYGALKTLDAVEVTIYLNATTTLAIGWGALIFHEKIGLLYLGGAACIIGAVFLASRKVEKLAVVV